MVGRYGVQVRKESGEGLVRMCSDRELVVGNHGVRKRDEHMYTWVMTALGGRAVRVCCVDFKVIGGGGCWMCAC